MKEPNAKKSSVSIEDAALRHLSARSRTTAEMGSYLAGKGFDEDSIKGLLSRFGRLRLSGRRALLPRVLPLQLWQRQRPAESLCGAAGEGVDAALIENAYEDYCLEEGEPDERQRAREEADKVLRAAGLEPGTPVPEKIVARAARRLSSKGYSSDVIYSVIGDLRE